MDDLLGGVAGGVRHGPVVGQSGHNAVVLVLLLPAGSRSSLLFRFAGMGHVNRYLWSYWGIRKVDGHTLMSAN